MPATDPQGACTCAANARGLEPPALSRVVATEAAVEELDTVPAVDAHLPAEV